MTHRFLLGTIALSISISLFAQDNNGSKAADDESNVTQLEELVVKAENAWFENGKAVFIPQKNEKNLARDASSLIDRMNTGILFVRDGEIKTYNNESVAIYINGVKADEMDLSTFWPKNATRVEFIPVASNSEFSDTRNILNFIMRDYSAGGLTKLMADQTFPNDGHYSVSSKLVYRKMTFNAIFKGGYSRDHFSNSDFVETFDNVWYDGYKYDRITHEEHNDAYARSNDIYGGFNARYRNNKWTITHTAALQWNQDPGSGSHGLSIYTPELFSGNEAFATNDSRNLSPQITGLYNFSPGGKWRFNIFWSFRHSHNNYNSSFTEASLKPIENRVKENLYRYTLNLMAGFTPSYKTGFEFYLIGLRNLSDAHYTGYTISNQWQSSGTSSLVAYWWYRPIDKITLTLTPRLDIYDFNINHIYKDTQWIPGIDLRAYYNINRKNSIDFMLWYSQTSPQASTRNDLVLRQNELKWIEGYPSLRPSQKYWISLGYQLRPTNWLNSSFSISYILKHNESMIEYRSGGMEYDGIIGKYVNGKNVQTLQGQWDVSFSLFDGNLRLTNSLTYSYARSSLMGSLGFFRTRPSVAWYFGNCSLSASYGSPQKLFNNAGSKKIRTSHYYGLDFSYGNGNFIVDISINEPFNKRLSTRSWTLNGPYASENIDWRRGRNISVSLTYTFDYGKKVDSGIDINTQNIQSTSVLGSDL